MKMTVPLLLLTPERLSDKIHFYFSITHSRAFLPEIGNKTRKTTTTPCTVMYNGRLAAMIERNKCGAAYFLFTFICARSAHVCFLLRPRPSVRSIASSLCVDQKFQSPLDSRGARFMHDDLSLSSSLRSSPTLVRFERNNGHGRGSRSLFG